MSSYPALDNRFAKTALHLPSYRESERSILESEVRQSFKTSQQYLDHSQNLDVTDSATAVQIFFGDPTDADVSEEMFSGIYLFLRDAGVPDKYAFTSATCANEIIENTLKHAFCWKPGNITATIAIANKDAHQLIIRYKDPLFDPVYVAEIYKLRQYNRAKKDVRFLFATSKMGLELTYRHFDHVLPCKILEELVEYRLTKIHRNHA